MGTSAGGAVTTAIGSARNNSRSINSMNRQMSKQYIMAASGNTSCNRNSGSQQIMISNSQAKTPVGAQLSTGVTTGSQKYLLLNTQQNNSTNQSAMVGNGVKFNENS